MISLPEKQVCYLSKLSDSLPSPPRLIRAFKKVKQVLKIEKQCKYSTRALVAGLVLTIFEGTVPPREVLDIYLVRKVRPGHSHPDPD